MEIHTIVFEGATCKRMEPFGSKTTADDVTERYGDLSEKVFIVTGATRGIGKETALALAKKGATVVIGCRSEDGAKAVVDESGEAKVEYIHLELSSFKSIKAFAKEFLSKDIPLHCLINNAGLMLANFQTTEEGFERVWGVNYLGHYYLTSLLLDKLKKSAPSRIVNVSSSSHQIAYWDTEKFPPKEEHFTNPEQYNFSYVFSDYGLSYGLSKLCLIFHTKTLHKKLEGTKVSAFAVDPGAVETNVVNVMTTEFPELAEEFKDMQFKTPAQGAACSVYCAVSDEVLSHSGEYFFQCKPEAAIYYTDEKENQDLVWNVSEKAVQDFEGE